MSQDANILMSDLVSVVMPLYNGERYVRDAIASVQAQTEPRWELLVVDDGSTDTGPALVAAIAKADARVRLMRTPNAGAAAARNVGLHAARGEFITFLDCDDWWQPRAIELLRNVCRVRGAAYGHYDVVGPTGEQLVTQRIALPKVGLQELLEKHAVWTCANMLRRDVLGSDRFDVGQVGYEDHDLWLRLAHRGVVWHEVDEVIASYRIRPASHSKNHANTLMGSQRAQLRAYERLLAQPDAARRASWDDARQQVKLHELGAIYAARAAVSFAGAPLEAGAFGVSLWARAMGPKWLDAKTAAQHGFWAVIYERGAWPDASSVGEVAWPAKLTAFWHACEQQGWAAPGTADEAWPLLCARAIRDEAIADALLDAASPQLAASDAALTIVGLGRNGSVLARRALQRGLVVRGRDDRLPRGPWRDDARVFIDAMHDPYPRGPVVVSPLEDGELCARLAHVPHLRWNAARASLHQGLLAKARVGVARSTRAA